MNCPACTSDDTTVTSTFNYGTAILRYRRCRACDHRWKAWEEIDGTPVRPRRSPAERVMEDLFDPRRAGNE